MRLPILIATILIVIAAGGLGYGLGQRIGPSTTASALLGATPVASAPLDTLALTGTPTQTPTATATIVLATASPVPRATLPPVFTPTPIKVIAAPATGQKPGSANPSKTAGATPPPQPTNTTRPTFTPTATPTHTFTPTATPTPEYDFVVVELTAIPRPEYRDTAIIRGKLIDQKGNLVPGTYFQIDSDAVPKWEAVEPHGTTPADGTATFVVTKGRFAVRVLGGRSEYAGWMVTGTPGSGPMSDWEFAFQLTQPLPPGILVSPTSTPTPAP